MSRAAEEIAAVLLDTGAFLVRPEQPFRLTSGLHAPFYVNCRLILSRPEARAKAAAALAATVPQPGATVIAGGVTAGVPFATLVADRLALPMVYVRTEAKAHGTAARIEGGDVEGARVHLIEDLISTAGSILAFAQALRDAGAEVDRVSVLFSRAGASAQQALEEAGLALTAICDLDTLLAVALSSGRIDENGLSEVRAFLADPEGWSAARDS
ncbi:MAG: orotate phosphoribosyltransferase [Rhodospirillales bacterium]|nr:orotate phosphoribosyltransferase [Rhodospirillales bacterium]